MFSTKNDILYRRSNHYKRCRRAHGCLEEDIDAVFVAFPLLFVSDVSLKNIRNNHRSHLLFFMMYAERNAEFGHVCYTRQCTCAFYI